MKKITTWIVVADHQHARVLANSGPGSGLKPVIGMGFETHLKAGRDINADRPGRNVGSRGGPRHGVGPRADPHRLEAERFVGRVAKALSAASEKKAYDKLVLIAPPRALGEFRKLLPAAVRGKLIGEIDEDLTKATTKALDRYVGDFLRL